MCDPSHPARAMMAIQMIPYCEYNRVAATLLGAGADMFLSVGEGGREERHTELVAQRADLLLKLLACPSAEELIETGEELAERDERHRAAFEQSKDGEHYERPDLLQDLLRLAAIGLAQEPGESRSPSEILRDEATILALSGADEPSFKEALAETLVIAKTDARERTWTVAEVVAVEQVLAKVLGRSYKPEYRASMFTPEQGGTAQPKLQLEDLQREANERIDAGESPMEVLKDISARMAEEAVIELGLAEPQDEEQLDLEAMLREIEDLPEIERE